MTKVYLIPYYDITAFSSAIKLAKYVKEILNDWDIYDPRFGKRFPIAQYTSEEIAILLDRDNYANLYNGAENILLNCIDVE